MLVYGLGLPLPSNPQGQSRVENEFSEVSFVDQVPKVPSEGSTIHYEITSPFTEGTIVSRSRLCWVRWEGSGQTPDPKMVFDGIEDLIDRYSEWGKVELCFTPLAKSSGALRWLANNGGIMARILPKGNYGFGFSTSGPCLGGRLDVARVASSIWMNF